MARLETLLPHLPAAGCCDRPSITLVTAWWAGCPNNQDRRRLSALAAKVKGCF